MTTTEKCPIALLHRSKNFIVVDKPPDMLINSNVESDVTVHRLLAIHFPELNDPRLTHGFRFCHRLDFSTSGVLCLALHKRAAGLAGRAFENRSTTKHYVALVHGHLVVPDGDADIVITLGVGPDTRPGNEHRMCTSDEPHCGLQREAVTRVTPLACGTYAGVPVTKVLLVPQTGRRHQLRVHCKAVGHTIVGDFTYSDRLDTGPPRMCLHALRLQLSTELECLDVLAPDPFPGTDDLAGSEVGQTDKLWVASSDL